MEVFTCQESLECCNHSSNWYLHHPCDPHHPYYPYYPTIPAIELLHHPHYPNHHCCTHCLHCKPTIRTSITLSCRYLCQLFASCLIDLLHFVWQSFHIFWWFILKSHLFLASRGHSAKSHKVLHWIHQKVIINTTSSVWRYHTICAFDYHTTFSEGYRYMLNISM